MSGPPPSTASGTGVCLLTSAAWARSLGVITADVFVIGALTVHGEGPSPA